METSKLFPDGGVLDINFTGFKNGEITYSSDVNEGLDREVTTTIKTVVDYSVSVERVVKQLGKREPLVCTDGLVFDSNGKTINVLKNGIR